MSMKAKKEVTKKETKKVAAPKAATSKKGAPAGEEKMKAAGKVVEETAAPQTEGGEEMDEDDMADAASSGSSGASAGLAMATAAATESSTSLKNFRHHPEMENFYRFIYENDLRYEALGIMNEIVREKRNLKALKTAKGKAH